LTTASAEIGWTNGFSPAGTFEREFSNVTRSYAGQGRRKDIAIPSLPEDENGRGDEAVDRTPAGSSFNRGTSFSPSVYAEGLIMTRLRVEPMTSR
jgi:hypothetical protein